MEIMRSLEVVKKSDKKRLPYFSPVTVEQFPFNSKSQPSTWAKCLLGKQHEVGSLCILAVSTDFSWKDTRCSFLVAINLFV